MSKSYNMAGWRIGYMVGNRELVGALARIKSYHDYGTFTPIQVALDRGAGRPAGLRQRDRGAIPAPPRRLARGLHEAGWNVEIPKASMYIWAQIPEPYRAMGSLSSPSVSCRMRRWPCPRIGFGEYGDEYVRFALIENEQRTRQAVRGIRICSARTVLLK